MRQWIGALSLVVALLLSSAGLAQVSDLRLAGVDNSVALDGYFTTDLLVSFAGQYTGAQLRLDLERGSIFQSPYASTLPQNAGLFAVFPEMEFDTFVAQGSATLGGPFGEPSLGGGAVDLGGPAVAEFSESRLNQSWNPAGGAEIVDQSDLLLARLTLSRDAIGVLRVLVSAAGEQYVSDSIPLLLVDPFPNDPLPEPNALVLATLALTFWLGNRASLRARMD